MSELNIKAITKEEIDIYSYIQSLKKICKKVNYVPFCLRSVFKLS